MKSEKSFAAGCLLALVLIHPAAWQPSHAQPGAPAQAPTPAQTPAPTPAPQTVTGGGQSVAPAQAANVARGENFEVRVSRVVSFSTGEAVVLSVDFDYEFLGRETVHLKGVGVVPSSGSLKFLILEPRLEFREAAGGSLLATVPLAETVVLQGASFDVPKESDLTATAREELWTGGGLFTNRARSVLNASFATGRPKWAAPTSGRPPTPGSVTYRTASSARSQSLSLIPSTRGTGCCFACVTRCERRDACRRSGGRRAKRSRRRPRLLSHS